MVRSQGPITPTNNNNPTSPTTATQQQKRQRRVFRVAYAGFAVGIAICFLLTVHLHSSLHIHLLDEHQSPLRTQQQEGTVKQHGTSTADVINHTNVEDEGISACLLINDENPRLPEWISYHYQTLPLRALIIAIDPASRSLPNDIILQWLDELPNVYIRPWTDKKYLPPQMRGPCKSNDPDKCLWHHRDRQQYFVMKCMSEFKKMNKTWVLITDVDEYILPNRIHDDDPIPPLDQAPEGIRTMINWKYHSSKFGDIGMVDGYILDNTKEVPRKQYVKSDIILMGQRNDTVLQYGTVVEDIKQQKYFLRDDIAHLEATSQNIAPPGVPTVKEPWFAGKELYVRIYNDVYDNNKDGTFMPLSMGWNFGDEKMRVFYGGHVITDTMGRKYFVENEARLWPRRYLAKDSMAARRRLPSVDEHVTILDILKQEAKESYTNGNLGPCLSIPRMLYGSREDNGINNRSSVIPDGFNEHDFVTLRYRWHASKGEFEASKYGKTIIDVSRIPQSAFRGKALNIHRPLTYYCRKDPARYELSLFRVNHYLDSFEAYSYRNDARANQRQCKDCYEKKGSGAAIAMDDDIRPWLQMFVENVGYEKARRLLSKAGNFVKLG